MKNANMVQVYRCPKCGAWCTGEHINKATVYSYGDNISPIEEDIDCYFVCPECGADTNEWSEWKEGNKVRADEDAVERKVLRYKEKLAEDFVKAITELVNNPKNLDNLEIYLTHHFPEWVEKYCGTPEDMVTELQQFAEMEI